MAEHREKTFIGGIDVHGDRIETLRSMVSAASRVSGYKTSAQEIRDIAEREHLVLTDDQLQDILSANDPDARDRQD